jgi:hypothetical protein
MTQSQLRAGGSPRRLSGFRWSVFGALLLASAALGPTASATWSIVVVNKETKEVAVGSATCLSSFDLLAGLPVMLVDVGGAAAQSRVDSGGTNRQRIRLHMGLLGTHPLQILRELERFDGSHQSRQYGIVDTDGRVATFTGSEAGPFAGGLVGRMGPLHYAIQGNVITGLPVLLEAERALRETPGDLPEKLMAAMEAARAMGGDGRCSCNPNDPPGCGSPPPEFEKSAHIAFMIDARSGDTDGGCSSSGCAGGNYYMRFNVAFQPLEAPDPVFQLRTAFDIWRAGLLGVPDHVRTTAELDPPQLPTGEQGVSTMTVTLRDWQDNPVDGTGITLAVTHATGSDGITTVSDIRHLGGGVFQATLTGNGTPGRDRFLVRLTGEIRAVVVIPYAVLPTGSIADLDRNGVVDGDDLELFAGCMGGPETVSGDACARARLTSDRDVDLEDFLRFMREVGE